MAKGTILLVDDERDLVKLVINRLEAEGYDVLAAYDGAQALEKARGSLGLILLDIMMPGMDGLEVLRRLRAKEETRETPVIMFTALGATKTIFDAQAAGATDYIIKPFKPEELLSLIKKYIF